MLKYAEMIETKTARIWMREDGIACIKVVTTTEQTRADVEESMSHVANFNKGRKSPLLIDISESAGIDREGRVYSASDEVGKLITSMAILIKSPFSRMMGNFWIRTTNPLFPTKLFTSDQKAIEWLNDYKI